MKLINFFIPMALFILLLSSSSMKSVTTLAEKYSNDYECTIINKQIESRFETQFKDLFKDVTRVDAHLNEFGNYYYVVYGVDSKNQEVIELFKTTKYEVMNEMYDYIEMPKTGTSFTTFCYEFANLTEYQNNGWCSRYNSGVRCAYWTGYRCGYYF